MTYKAKISRNGELELIRFEGTKEELQEFAAKLVDAAIAGGQIISFARPDFEIQVVVA